MGSLILGIALVLIGIIVIPFLPLGPRPHPKVRSTLATVLIAGGIFAGGTGGVAYNDAGYCQHIRNVFGTESSRCTTGWYALLWGSSTQYPHFITVTNTSDPAAEGSSITGPYPVRLADNWNGDVTQTTRFAIPQDSEQFITMARTFRSPERLISTTLRPAITSTLDSVSNLFTMEQYYAGGQRDEYKTEFRNGMIKGRARVKQVTSFVDNFFRPPTVTPNDATANDLETVVGSGSVGNTTSRIVVMEKILDPETGEPIRVPHGYAQYGIVVASAILENLDPDDLFEQQIQARKDAASRRIVAQEERKEQAEQRLLAIERGQTDIAIRQAAAEVEQIEQTTDAETTRQLAVIAATQIREEASITKQTAAINLETARITAETVTTLADADAYERRVILEADNALQAKLDAWVEIQGQWAQAAADINVPDTVFNMGGSTDGGTTGNFGSVEAFMSLLTANAAKQLALDPSISGDAKME